MYVQILVSHLHLFYGSGATWKVHNLHSHSPSSQYAFPTCSILFFLQQDNNQKSSDSTYYGLHYCKVFTKINPTSHLYLITKFKGTYQSHLNLIFFLYGSSVGRNFKSWVLVFGLLSLSFVLSISYLFPLILLISEYAA